MTTLYEQLGGAAAVDAAVTHFYDLLLDDPRVMHLFYSIDMPRQIRKQKQFLTYIFGGPGGYDGKSMREAHRHLNLTEEHFRAVMEHVEQTLKDLSIREELRQQVLKIAASHRDEVLNL